MMNALKSLSDNLNILLILVLVSMTVFSHSNFDSTILDMRNDLLLCLQCFGYYIKRLLTLDQSPKLSPVAGSFAA